MKLLQNLFGGQTAELDELQNLFVGVTGQDAKYLACFSLLLAKIANADDQVTEGEKSIINAVLAKHAGLTPDRAKIVAIAALKKSLVKSLDVKAICEELKTCSSPEQRKNAMVSCLYVASDGGISESEIQRMHGIARLLGFSFKDWQGILAEFNGTSAEQAS